MRQLKITKSITNRESASLDKYLQEIGREELVSVEEEVARCAGDIAIIPTESNLNDQNIEFFRIEAMGTHH